MVRIQLGGSPVQGHPGDMDRRSLIHCNGQGHMGTGFMGIRSSVTHPIRSRGQIGYLRPLHCFPGDPIVGGPFHGGVNPGNAPIRGTSLCCIGMCKSLRRSLWSSDHHRLEIIEVHGGIGITVDAE
ncbi:hypothetical protein D3C81_1849280 [compost metagenome]